MPDSTTLLIIIAVVVVLGAAAWWFLWPETDDQRHHRGDSVRRSGAQIQPSQPARSVQRIAGQHQWAHKVNEPSSKLREDAIEATKSRLTSIARNLEGMRRAVS